MYNTNYRNNRYGMNGNNYNSMSSMQNPNMSGYARNYSNYPNQNVGYNYNFRNNSAYDYNSRNNAPRRIAVDENSTPSNLRDIQDIGEKCDIDINDIQNRFQNIENDISVYSTKDQIYDLLLSDDFYKKVDELSKKIRHIDSDKIKCLLGNKDELCLRANEINQNAAPEIERIEKINKVLDKYQHVIVDTRKWLKKNIADIYKYCGTNPSNLAKLDVLMKNLSKKMGELAEGREIRRNELSDLENEKNKWKTYTYILLIILIIIVLFYLFNQKQPMNI